MSSGEGDHRAIVAGAIAGDPSAVRTLIRIVGPVVHGRVAKALARRRGARGSQRAIEQEIEDQTQEVFASLFEDGARALRAWDPERGPLGGFVALLADHHVFSLFRSGRRRPWSDELDALADPEALAVDGASPESRVASREELELLLERLRADLSPKGFDVFVRLYVDEQPIETVARDLAMTPDALYAWRTRLSKRVRALAMEIGARMSDPAPGMRIGSMEAP